MKRIIIFSLALCLLGFAGQTALAGPACSGCGNTDPCPMACGENNCACDSGAECVCEGAGSSEAVQTVNNCQCAAPCNDDSGCSSDCPTVAKCRPAAEASDNEGAAQEQNAVE